MSDCLFDDDRLLRALFKEIWAVASVGSQSWFSHQKTKKDPILQGPQREKEFIEKQTNPEVDETPHIIGLVGMVMETANLYVNWTKDVGLGIR